MRPLLKWAGGKSSILNKIKKYIPHNLKEYAYHEVFFGGGALFFDIQPEKGTINDINKKLMNFYNIIKERPYELINEAAKYQEYSMDEIKYYELRNEFNKDNISNIKSAALFLYFNKTSYNGLYRVNSKNIYNVPIGKYKNPTILNKNKVLEASKILKNIKIFSKDFNYILKEAYPKDICYFDPPYYQSEPNKFTDYSQNGFNIEDHERLCATCAKLNDNNVFFILSNSNSNKIKDMYNQEGFDIVEINSKWMISCNASSRGKVKEILVHNFNSF